MYPYHSTYIKFIHPSTEERSEATSLLGSCSWMTLPAARQPYGLLSCVACC
ncbi:hypothetical protein VPHK225_0058 [Vibrio phage K225]